MDVDRALRGPARDPALPRARRRPLRPAARHPARHARRRGGLRRVPAIAGRSTTDAGDALLRGLPDHGDRLPVGAAHPRHPRPRALRRGDAPHGPLAARGRRRRRQAGRHHRHRLLGGAGDPDHRRRGRAPDGLPAHRRTSASRPGTARSTPRRSASARRATTCSASWRAPRPRATRGTRESRASGTRRPRSASTSSRRATRRRVLPPLGLRDLFTDPAANELAPSSCARRSASASTIPRVAELLCPYDHPFGTKRMCIDTDYFETYNRANVRLVRSASGRSTSSRSAACASATRSSRSTRSSSPPASTR